MANRLPERKGNYPEFGQGYPEFKSGSVYTEFGNMNSLGFGGNDLLKFVKSLNPIFLLDLDNVSGGYYTDLSGNNKQIAATKTTTTNDTLTLPASDTSIITALTTAGLYPMYYTNDTTPKAVKISTIKYNNSAWLWASFDMRYLALFANPVISTDRTKLDNATKLYYTQRYQSNLAYTLNYFNKSRADVIQATGYAYQLFTSDVGAKCVYSWADNAFSWSVLKKTITCTVTNSDATQGLFTIYPMRFTGKYTLAFWVLKTNIPVNFSIAVGVESWTFFGKAQMVLNATKTSGLFTGIIDAVDGDWCHFTIKSTNVINSGASNDLLYDPALFIRCTGAATAGANYVIDFTDINIINDHITFDRNVNYMPVEVSPFLSKKLCVIGDSITAGTWGIYLANLLGIKDYYNAGKSGGRMTNLNGADTWMPTYMEEASATNADLFVFMAAANDANTIIAYTGSLDGNNYNNYLDSYNLYLDYLITNNPTATILILTMPLSVGGLDGNGNPLYTKQQVLDIYETMRSAVYQIPVKYPQIKVFDLYNQCPLRYENFYKFIPDGTHNEYSLHVSDAHLIAKFIKANY